MNMENIDCSLVIIFILAKHSRYIRINILHIRKIYMCVSLFQTSTMASCLKLVRESRWQMITKEGNCIDLHFKGILSSMCSFNIIIIIMHCYDL